MCNILILFIYLFYFRCSCLFVCSQFIWFTAGACRVAHVPVDLRYDIGSPCKQSQITSHDCHGTWKTWKKGNFLIKSGEKVEKA